MQIKNFFVLAFCLSLVSLQAQMVRDSIASRTFEPVIITSQFVPTDVRETVNSVKVINKETIQQRAAVTLGELLQTEANMRITQDAILGTGLNLNGLQGQNIKILIDGVPVNGRQNGSIDAGQLSLAAVQQIEIIEGAQSLLYGSDASAGVVNLVSKRSQAHRVEVSANSQYESVGLLTAQSMVGLRFGKWYAQLSGNMLSFEPKTDTAYGRDQLWNPKMQYSGKAMLRYSHSKALDLRLSSSTFYEKVDDYGNLRRPQYKPYAFDDYYTSKRRDVNLSGEGWTKSNWFWQGTVALNRFDKFENTYRYDFDEELKTLIPGDQDTTVNLGILSRFTIASDNKKHAVNYLFGIDNHADFIQGLRVLDSTANKMGHANRNDFGLFSSIKYKICDELTLQGGARWTNNSLYGSAFTPSLWAKYKPKNNLMFRASYANGFRSPDLLELYYNFVDINHYVVGNVDLQPERSHNFRAEVDWNPRIDNDFDISFGTRGFYNKVNNRIVLLEFAPVQYRYLNLNQWETLGASLGISLNYKNWLNFSSQAQRTGFYNSFVQEHDTLSRFNWSLDWTNEVNISLFDKKLGLSFWHKLTGATPYFLEENSEMKKGLTEKWEHINVSANTFLFDRNIRLNAGVKNLLDVRQIRANTEVFGHNGAGGERPVSWGRSFFVSLIFNVHSKN